MFSGAVLKTTDRGPVPATDGTFDRVVITDDTTAKLVSAFRRRGDKGDLETELRICERLGPVCQLAASLGIVETIGHPTGSPPLDYRRVDRICLAMQGYHMQGEATAEPLIREAFAAGIELGRVLDAAPRSEKDKLLAA